MSNRILFARNPWPRGHRITELRWSGRVEPEQGLWFDLHLVTAAYDAEDRKAPASDADEDSRDDGWRAKGAWQNYSRCTLSSTAWRQDDSAPEDDEARGFLVATAKRPLDFDALARRPFRVDVPPVDLANDAPRAFSIYLLGHDSVADHRILFARRAGPVGYALRWEGRIALTYAGDARLRHRFEARAARVDFQGFAVPEGVGARAARQLLEPMVTDASRYDAVRRRGRIFMRPRLTGAGSAGSSD